MPDVFDEYVFVYQEINNDAHRKAANLIGAPAFVWHQAFWNPRQRNRAVLPEVQSKLIEDFVKDLHAHIKNDIKGSCIDPLEAKFEIRHDDRVRTITFQFIWQHLHCKIRIENHSEYLTITSIVDASIDCSEGDAAQRELFKSACPHVYANIDKHLNNFRNGTAQGLNETVSIFEGGADAFKFIYTDIWTHFGIEVLTIKDYMAVQPGNVGADRVKIGLKFAEFKGFVTCEQYPKEGDAGKADRAKEDGEGLKDWLGYKDKVQGPFHKPKEGVRGQWHRNGKPGPNWARRRVNNMWPFLSLTGDTDLSLLKGRIEFTVSRLLNGRMLYVTALGPQADDKKHPVYFYLHSATQCERQIGRMIDRVCQLGTNRLAAIISLPALKDISESLWGVEDLVQQARQRIHEFIRPKEHRAEKAPRKFSFRRTFLNLCKWFKRTILRQRRPNSAATKGTDKKNIKPKPADIEKTIIELFDGIQTAMATLSGGVGNREGEELGIASIEFRLLRSKYYRTLFYSLIPDLRLKRLEGYQPYDEFVNRRLGTAFGFIDGIEGRIQHIRDEWRSLDQLYLAATVTKLTREIGQRENEIKDVQKWGERILCWVLMPYYALSIIFHNLVECEQKVTNVTNGSANAGHAHPGLLREKVCFAHELVNLGPINLGFVQLGPFTLNYQQWTTFILIGFGFGVSHFLDLHRKHKSRDQ